MSNNDEQIEIDLGTPEVIEKEPDIEVVKAEDSPEPVRRKDLSVQDGVEELRAKLKASEAARNEAEQRANQATQREFQAKNEVEDTNLHLVNNAITTVQRNVDVLKGNLRDAMAVGDYDKVAEIQHAMSMNASQLVQLENGRDAMKNQPRQAPPAPRAIDPVEAVASSLTPRSADWVRRNPQFVTDPRLYQKMVAAHNLAIADGYDADSDDYFNEVESTLKINRHQDNDDDASSAAAKPVQRRQAPPSAPVSRSGTGTGTRPNVVRLNAAERDMAEVLGMTPEDYARNKIALQKEGRIN